MTAINEPVKESSEREFTITRVFTAPRGLVFNAWTDPKLLAQWWGPHGFTNPVCEIDLRPGGTWRIVMRGPDGTLHPTKGVYHDIIPPERLVLSIDHSDMPEQWHDLVNPGCDPSKGRPKLEAITIVSLTERAGKTTLTVRQRFESPTVRDALLKIGMSEGWSQSMERLGMLLEKLGQQAPAGIMGHMTQPTKWSAEDLPRTPAA